MLSCVHVALGKAIPILNAFYVLRFVPFFFHPLMLYIYINFILTTTGYPLFLLFFPFFSSHFFFLFFPPSVVSSVVSFPFSLFLLVEVKGVSK